MAKQLSTGAKVAIWIGVLATVGVSGYFIHQAYKKWKANKDAGNINDSDIITPNDSSITPKDTSTPDAVKLKSFEDVVKSLGSNAKKFDTYVTLTGVPETFGLPAKIGGRIQAKFQKDTGYRLYFIPAGSSETQLLHGGLYWNGGKNLKVYNDILNKGTNKGLIVESSTPIGALTKASKV